MVTNAQRFEQWEKNWVKSHTSHYEDNLRLFEGMYLEARTLGILPLKKPLEDIQRKIDLAKALNVSRNH